MHAHRIIGLPAVGRESGRRWGVVCELLCDLEQARLSAVRVSARNWPARRKILAYGLMAENRLLVEEPPLAGGGGENLLGWVVRTEDGRELGKVGDLLVDEQGVIQGYEVSGGLLQDLLQGRAVLPARLARGIEPGVLQVAAWDDARGG